MKIINYHYNQPSIKNNILYLKNYLVFLYCGKLLKSFSDLENYLTKKNLISQTQKNGIIKFCVSGTICLQIDKFYEIKETNSVYDEFLYTRIYIPKMNDIFWISLKDLIDIPDGILKIKLEVL